VSTPRQRLGLPHAGHSQSQPAPAGPTTGHSGAPQVARWHLWKNRFKKRQMLHGSEE